MTSTSGRNDSHNETVDVTSRDVESRHSRRDVYESEMVVQGLSDDDDEDKHGKTKT